MMLKPNSTWVEGTVRKLTQAADGWGADVEFEVARNLTESPADDCVQAKAGQVLKVFAARPDDLKEGSVFKLKTTRLGGPQGTPGGRIVVQEVEKLSE